MKEYAEIAFWSRVHNSEGKDAFNQESCLNGIHNKYCTTLGINSETFRDKVVLDIGCGPRGSLHKFKAKAKFGLDPLAKVYDTLYGTWKHDMIYLASPAEDIPLVRNSVDFVIAVNSLDHVDNIDKVMQEVRRVIKPNGIIIVNLNLQAEATITEPIVHTEKGLPNMFKGFDYSIKKEYPATDGVPFRRLCVSGIKK